MRQLGRNAHGETLDAGRVSDCYLSLRLDPPGETQPASVLIVSPFALLHPTVPRPVGTLLYELMTGQPDRAPGELVFLADLTVELRAWPADIWSKVGVDPQAAARAVITAWQDVHIKLVLLAGLTPEEALALERPAMTYVRAQLCDRLQRQLAQAYWQWLSSTQRMPTGRPLPVAADTRSVARVHCLRQMSATDTPRLGQPAASRFPSAAADTACGGRRPLPQPAGVADTAVRQRTSTRRQFRKHGGHCRVVRFGGHPRFRSLVGGAADGGQQT
jgi:hypothetical protein